MGDHSPWARAIAKAVTQMARAIPGGCEAEDVDRAVARRRFFQALGYWRPAVAPGGATANSTRRIRAPPTLNEEEGTPSSLMHVIERGKKNVVVRVSRASCVEWSDARESVFMVCGRHPRRVLKLRSRKPDAVRKLSIHHSPLLFTSQTHVCSDTGAAHDQRRHTPGCSDGICANTQELITRFASATPELLRQRLEVGVQF